MQYVSDPTKLKAVHAFKILNEILYFYPQQELKAMHIGRSQSARAHSDINLKESDLALAAIKS
jgi:hypothetical protein